MLTEADIVFVPGFEHLHVHGAVEGCAEIARADDVVRLLARVRV